MINIDGINYDVPIKDLGRKTEFLDKFAERTESGVLKRELIGRYFNYSLVFGRARDRAQYTALWQKLTEKIEFHTVILPDEDGDATFIMYVSNVTDKLVRSENEKRYWSELTVNFVSKSPAP